MITKFDLSTLNLPEGSHSITVKARASGYLASPKSNAVDYTVAGEVSYILSGTWAFKEYPKLTSGIGAETVAFTSNNVSYSSIEVDKYGIYYSGVLAADHVPDGEDMWTNKAYRFITFDGEQTVSEKFYEWFTTYAIIAPALTGVWVFNKKLTIPGKKNEKYQDDYDIHFTSYLFSQKDYTEFDGMGLGRMATGFTPYLAYSPVNDDSYYLMYGGLQTNTSKDKWNENSEPECKTVNFGTNPQLVFPEFYDFITANAAQQT